MIFVAFLCGRLLASRPRWASALVVLILSGCAMPAPPATVMQTATPLPAAIEADADQVARAIAGRRDFGLRADEAYVRQLFADPAAVALGQRLDFDFPLTAAEAVELRTRLASMEAVAETIAEYGEAHPDDWAGLFADQARGVVVGQFRNNVDQHRAAIGKLLPSGARYEIRAVPWTRKELQAIADRVAAEEAWLESIGADLEGWGVDEANNVALIDVLSLDPGVADLIIEHFNGEGKMRVRVSDKLSWEDGWGSVHIVALGPDGVGVPNLHCYVSSDTRFTYPQDGSTMDDPAGLCAFNLEATTHLIRITRPTAAGEVEVGRATITVVRDQKVVVHVPVDGG